MLIFWLGRNSLRRLEKLKGTTQPSFWEAWKRKKKTLAASFHCCQATNLMTLATVNHQLKANSLQLFQMKQSQTHTDSRLGRENNTLKQCKGNTGKTHCCVHTVSQKRSILYWLSGCSDGWLQEAVEALCFRYQWEGDSQSRKADLSNAFMTVKTISPLLWNMISHFLKVTKVTIITGKLSQGSSFFTSNLQVYITHSGHSSWRRLLVDCV